MSSRRGLLKCYNQMKTTLLPPRRIKPEGFIFHRCACTGYNGGQCYNCINGAHELCDHTPKCANKNSRQVGVKLVFR